MAFDPTAYGPDVAALLALDSGGLRLMPLVAGKCSCGEAARRIPQLKTANAGVIAGLWIYFSAFEQAHAAAQDSRTREGSYWHGILHRQEPDDGNARYWFDRVGAHPIFPALAEAATAIATKYRDTGWKPPARWDPSLFIACSAQARLAPGTPLEQLALEIQRAEWQLLFDFCAQSQ